MVEIKKVKEMLLVPFDTGGNQLGYNRSYGNNVIATRENEVFTGTMSYKGFSKGRSSIKFHFTNENGRSFEMFATDFDKLVKEYPVNIPLSGSWAFVKRGANFGLVKVIYDRS